MKSSRGSSTGGGGSSSSGSGSSTSSSNNSGSGGARVVTTTAASSEGARAKRDNLGVTLSSLGDLLGEEEAAAKVEESVQQARVRAGAPPPWQRTPRLPVQKNREMQDLEFKSYYMFGADEKIEEPKVLPFITWGLYYLQVAFYASYLWLEGQQGTTVADDVVDKLTNDHLAVASTGEVYRFLSCALVHDNPVQLFIFLFALVLLASEMEALIGHSAFASVFLTAVLTASFTDALMGVLPVTQGGYPALAGMLGALLAHQAKNWDFKIQQEDARDEVAGTPGLTSASEQEVELEIFEGLWTPRRLVTREAKAILTAGGAIVVAFQGLIEVSDSVRVGGDSFTSWPGIFVALAAGAVGGWFMSPRYRLRAAVRAELDADIAASSSDSVLGSIGSGFGGSPAEVSRSVSGDSLGSRDEAGVGASARRSSPDVVVLTDGTTPLQRAYYALSFNGVLAIMVVCWLYDLIPGLK